MRRYPYVLLHENKLVMMLTLDDVLCLREEFRFIRKMGYRLRHV